MDVNTAPVAMVTTIIGYTRVVTMVARSNGVDYQRTVVNGNLATTKSVTTRILYRTLISGNTVVPETVKHKLSKVLALGRATSTG